MQANACSPLSPLRVRNEEGIGGVWGALQLLIDFLEIRGGVYKGGCYMSLQMKLP
jgi:hypothetical protein